MFHLIQMLMDDAPITKIETDTTTSGLMPEHQAMAEETGVS